MQNVLKLSVAMFMFLCVSVVGSTESTIEYTGDRDDDPAARLVITIPTDPMEEPLCSGYPDSFLKRGLEVQMQLADLKNQQLSLTQAIDDLHEGSDASELKLLNDHIKETNLNIDALIASFKVLLEEKQKWKADHTE